MATTIFNLTDEWVQITTGAENATIQVLTGYVYLCDSASAPDENAPAHLVSNFISVSPPISAWCRAGSTDVITVTK